MLISACFRCLVASPDARFFLQNWRRFRWTLQRCHSTAYPLEIDPPPKPTLVRGKWETVVGLEIHAQIQTACKLFSSAPTSFTGAVNTQVSMFDAAIPGTLPVMNRECAVAGVATALALNCRVNPVSEFERKHYFYADLPAGYQITQQRNPLASYGFLDFIIFNPAVHTRPYLKRARIKQLQLEQDSGKSLHDEECGRSYIDLNRAGVGLMEIVFEPDLSDGEEAAALVKELSLILESLGTCSCKMEEGALRVDANVSLRRPSDTELGIRTEIKNLNSIRAVAGAIEYEANRQAQILDSKGLVENETRSYDAMTKRTVAMRDKETKQDYRFMPEPNLPPLRLLEREEHVLNPLAICIPTIRKSLPELPAATRTKLVSSYGLRLDVAIVLVNNPDLLSYFYLISRVPTRDTMAIANLLIVDVLGFLNKAKFTLTQCQVTPAVFGEALDLKLSGTISMSVLRLILEMLIHGDKRTPEQIVADNNWTQISDIAEIEAICQQVIAENQPLVQKHLRGKKKAFNSLMAVVWKVSNNRANMEVASSTMKKLLMSS